MTYTKIIIGILLLSMAGKEAFASCYSSDFLVPERAPVRTKVFAPGSFANTLKSYVMSLESDMQRGHLDRLKEANRVAAGQDPRHPLSIREATPDECELFAQLVKLNTDYCSLFGMVNTFAGLEVNDNVRILSRCVGYASGILNLHEKDKWSWWKMEEDQDPIIAHIQNCIKKLYGRAFSRPNYEKRKAEVMGQFSQLVGLFEEIATGEHRAFVATYNSPDEVRRRQIKKEEEARTKLKEQDKKKTQADLEKEEMNMKKSPSKKISHSSASTDRPVTKPKADRLEYEPSELPIYIQNIQRQKKLEILEIANRALGAKLGLYNEKGEALRGFSISDGVIKDRKGNRVRYNQREDHTSLVLARIEQAIREKIDQDIRKKRDLVARLERFIYSDDLPS